MCCFYEEIFFKRDPIWENLVSCLKKKLGSTFITPVFSLCRSRKLVMTISARWCRLPVAGILISVDSTHLLPCPLSPFP